MSMITILKSKNERKRRGQPIGGGPSNQNPIPHPIPKATKRGEISEMLWELIPPRYGPEDKGPLRPVSAVAGYKNDQCPLQLSC